MRKLEIEEYYQHIKRKKLRANRKAPTLMEEKQPKLGCSTCRKMKVKDDFD